MASIADERLEDCLAPSFRTIAERVYWYTIKG